MIKYSATILDKVLKFSLLLFSSLTAILLSGCLNQYEVKCVGLYKVGHYELVDSSKELKHDLPTLIVNADKTFLLEMKDKIIKGKWEADDYGDWTVIDFYYNEHDVQGEILNENQIDILNPYLFYCPFLKKLIFEKVKEGTSKIEKSERTT